MTTSKRRRLAMWDTMTPRDKQIILAEHKRHIANEIDVIRATCEYPDAIIERSRHIAVQVHNGGAVTANGEFPGYTLMSLLIDYLRITGQDESEDTTP